jgi:hypothetical protein
MEFGSPEAQVLRELLADAHTRIRELEEEVERLTAALLTARLSDRRRAYGGDRRCRDEAHPERRSGGDRRSVAVWPVQPGRIRHGNGWADWW